MPAESKEEHWFALWVYRNLVNPVVNRCKADNVQYYIPMRLRERFGENGVEYVEEPVIQNLLFVRSSAEYLLEIKRVSYNRAIPYHYPGTALPAVIDDRAMEIFMFVAKTGARCLESVQQPIDKGDRVRVTDGIFKGAEGYVRRVHGTKRFVVAIDGIAAVAVTHIPRQFLERVAPAGEPAEIPA